MVNGAVSLPSPSSSTFRAVRGWLTLGVSVLLIAWGLVDGDSATVLLGFSGLGVEPLARARQEVTA